jgi:hypothetical protein
MRAPPYPALNTAFIETSKLKLADNTLYRKALVESGIVIISEFRGPSKSNGHANAFCDVSRGR